MNLQPRHKSVFPQMGSIGTLPPNWDSKSHRQKCKRMDNRPQRIEINFQSLKPPRMDEHAVGEVAARNIVNPPPLLLGHNGGQLKRELSFIKADRKKSAFLDKGYDKNGDGCVQNS